MASSRRQAAQAFASLLGDKLGDNLISVSLFGSVARGDDEAGSDIHLLVTVDDEHEVPDISEEIGAWMVEHGDVLQVHMVSKGDYERIQGQGTAFANAINREGEALA